MESNIKMESNSMELNNLQSDLVTILKKNGALTRNQMVEKLNKPRTTIYDNLAVLINRDMIKKFSRQVNNRGRPVVFFKLKED